MLTKRHFAAIAKIVNETSVPIPDIGMKTRHLIPRDKLIEQLAEYFATENDLFNAARFREACVQESTRT